MSTDSPTLGMPVTAIAPWFGSKRTLASAIVAEFGDHRAYWEVPCGSMAPLLEKEPCMMETVCDLHGDLINLARVLADESLAVDLYTRLSRTLMSEELFKRLAVEWRERKHQPSGDELDVHRAYRFFVCSWLGRNGVAGTLSYNQGFCVRYTKNGGHGAKRFQSAIESIPAWHHRLRNVTILNRDMFEVLDRIEDAAQVVLYVDPPYFEKGAKYVHDFTVEDHERLAAALQRFKKTRVIVSYYDHPKLRPLYQGWTIVPQQANKSLVNQTKRDMKGATKAPEVLVINGPSFVQPRASGELFV